MFIAIANVTVIAISQQSERRGWLWSLSSCQRIIFSLVCLGEPQSSGCGCGCGGEDGRGGRGEKDGKVAAKSSPKLLADKQLRCPRQSSTFSLPLVFLFTTVSLSTAYLVF